MHKKTIAFILLLVLTVSGFVFMRDKKVTPVGILDAIPTKEVLLKNGETYELTAGYVMKSIAGKKIKMLAYNGMIPGPTLRAGEGDQATIRFVNNTDMPTLLHSHGIRMENQFDGTHLVQKDVLPGESFSYTLAFTDPGVFWYHPHVREDIQQNMGLYGNFVVTPKSADFWPLADKEETIFLSDVLMEGGDIAPYSEKYSTHALMGRFGNTILINGDTSLMLSGEPGEVRRMYVTNAATVRPFNFRVGGGARMKLIGGDNGRYEKETFVEGVIVSPSERAVIDVYFPVAGTYALLHAVPDGKTYPLGEVAIAGASIAAAGKTFDTLRANADVIAEFTALRSYLAAVPDKQLRLTLTMDMGKIMSHMGSGGDATDAHDHAATPSMDMSGMNMGSGSSGMPAMAMHTAVPIEWEDTMGDMNTFSTSDTVKWILRDEETGKENMDIAWQFPRGKYVKIRIINDATSAHPMQHPMHFHGNRFAVLSVNDVPNENMVWKDTTLLKTGDVVDILLETTNPGKWMAHCHIAEHMHSGMMLQYSVE